MRKLLRFLLQRWVLGLIGVVLFSLIVWLVGPLVAVAEYKPLASEGARFGTVLFLVLIWGFDNLFARHRERRAGERLTEKLTQPESAAKQKGRAAVVDPEQALLAQKLRDAIRVVQRARLGRGEKLYQLPWYVVIGAPGSGKTTALKNAGLKFPLESQLGDNPIQGAGGTRYCDWWFTDEAVLLDTAGRYTTQDDSKEGSGGAWRAFLGDLKKGRPKRPLNGIIVALSIEDLIVRTTTELALQSAAIKRRVQELNAHLDMELPVYVVFTKCDLIAGFNEFFADLEQEERQQVWGIALPPGRAQQGSGNLQGFDARFRELMARANDRVLHRLAGEPDPLKRTLMFEFPRQMLSLQERLSAILEEIFLPNQFEQPAWLRGVYFVSATQNTSLRRWVSGVLPVALCAAPTASAAAKAPRGYFLERLFKEMIFGEAHLASVNRRAERRFRWSYAALLAAIGIAFSAAATAVYLSHDANLQFLASVGDHIERYRETYGDEPPTGAEPWPELAARLQHLRSLPAGYDGPGELPSMIDGVGLDQSAKMGDQARWLYIAALERHFMPALADELATRVDASMASDEQLYESLRLYLMLSQRDRMDRDNFGDNMSDIWQQRHPGTADELARSQLDAHLDAALAEGVAAPPSREELVATARERLAQTPPDRRIYRRIKSEYMQELPGQFSVEGVLGRRARALFQRPSGRELSEGVPEFFSYRVFHTRFNVERKKFASRLAEEQWIYGDGGPTLSEQEIEGLSDSLNAIYFDEYQAAWKDLLQDLAIKRFADPVDGRVVAQLLASGDAPLVKLVLAAREHTDLSALPPSTKKIGKVAAVLGQNVAVNQRRRLQPLLPNDATAAVRLPGGEVSDAFLSFNEFAVDAEGLPLRRLQGAFGDLNRYFDTLAEADDRAAAAFRVRSDPGQGSAALAELRSALSAAPPTVRRWFGSVHVDADRVTQRGSQAHTDDAWRSEVMPFYEEAIKGRYPVDPQAEQEIRLDDFARFFGPGGILDSYFQRYVKPFAETGSGEWRWRRRVAMSEQSLQLFRRAKRIEAAWFDGQGGPRVRFTLRPRELDAAVTRSLLEACGSSITYEHGPVRSTRLQWPGDGGDQTRLVFNLASQGTPVSVRLDGPWSWFRLLDGYALGEPSATGSSLRLAFAVEGLRATYDVVPQRAANPFTDRTVFNFALPEQL